MLDANNLRTKPHCIFNLDETGLNTDRRSEPVFVNKDAKNAYLKSPTAGKKNYLVLFCVSATGIYLHPLTVYKVKNLYSSWTLGGPHGATYSCSESGWMMDINFENWFHNVFVKYTANIEKPILLTYDGHNSHLTYTTIKTAMDNSIIILCLPLNTSHTLQPLDIGVFRPIKVAWKKILNTWFIESRMQSVDKAVFPNLLSKLWQQLDPMHAVNAFRVAGLYPCDREAVRHRVIAASSGPSQAAPSTSAEAAPETPRKVLWKAILEVLSPPSSIETENAKAQKRSKRKRVQSTMGEVLTNKTVLKRLEQEATCREEKGKTKQMSAKVTEKVKIEKQCVRRLHTESMMETDSDSDLDIAPLYSNDNEIPTKSTAVDVRKLKEGVSYVIVKYEGSYFPGIVTKLGKTAVTVSCLVKSGPTHWKWPEREDSCDYLFEDIVSIITPPVMGNRGQCLIPDADKYWC